MMRVQQTMTIVAGTREGRDIIAINRNACRGRLCKSEHDVIGYTVLSAILIG